MSRRDNGVLRCKQCHLHQPLCVCAELPDYAPRARLVLLLHVFEARKPTNTGQLAVACMRNASVVTIGAQDAPAQPLRFAAHETPLLLYPGDDARPLDEVAASLPADAAPVLIVPDGNWRQASRMRKRVPGLASVPCVHLPTAPETMYRLRSEPKEGGLATAEAIAHAYAALGGADNQVVADAILRVFRIAVERTLWVRGQLPAAQVSGGVSEAARAFYRERAVAGQRSAIAARGGRVRRG